MRTKKPITKPATKKEWGRSHGLPPAQLKRIKVRRAKQAEASRQLHSPAPADGFEILYFDVNGKPTGFFRIRFDDYVDSWARRLGTKPRRYAQPTGTGVQAYFPPLIDWAKYSKDTAKPLLITEGELKSACATAHGFPCIGLGGVDSFGGPELLPELAAFEWKGRDVFIVYDSDAVKNPNVLRAENRLAAALVGRGARVHVVRLPEANDGPKVGLDDYIVSDGAPALEKLLGD